MQKIKIENLNVLSNKMSAVYGDTLQLGQVKPLIFSTMPAMGMPTLRQNEISRLTSFTDKFFFK
jgi:hypothetical protein